MEAAEERFKVLRLHLHKCEVWFTLFLSVASLRHQNPCVSLNRRTEADLCEGEFFKAKCSVSYVLPWGVFFFFCYSVAVISCQRSPGTIPVNWTVAENPPPPLILTPRTHGDHLHLLFIPFRFIFMMEASVHKWSHILVQFSSKSCHWSWASTHLCDSTGNPSSSWLTMMAAPVLHRLQRALGTTLHHCVLDSVFYIFSGLDLYETCMKHEFRPW